MSTPPRPPHFIGSPPESSKTPNSRPTLTYFSQDSSPAPQLPAMSINSNADPIKELPNVPMSSHQPLELPQIPPVSPSQKALLGLVSRADPSVANDVFRRLGNMLRQGMRLQHARGASAPVLVKPDPATAPPLELTASPMPPEPQQTQVESNPKKRERTGSSEDDLPLPVPPAVSVSVPIKKERFVHPEVLEPPPPKRPKRMSALRHRLLHPDHVAGEDDEIFDDGDIMDTDRNTNAAMEFELDGDDDDWRSEHNENSGEEDYEISESYEKFDDARSSREPSSSARVQPLAVSSAEETRELNGPDPPSNGEMIRQSIEIFNQKLPLITRWLHCPDFILVVGASASRHFAGKGGWNFIDLKFNVNGVPMTHGEFRAHMNSTSNKPIDFTLSFLECFSIVNGVLGWHKYTEWFPTAVRQGLVAFDADRLIPLRPPDLTPEQARWLAAADPNNTLQDPIQMKHPLVMTLVETAAALTQQLPAPIKGSQTRETYGIIFKVEIDWRYINLQFSVDVNGKVLHTLGDVAKHLQETPTSPKIERLALWAKPKGSHDAIWIKMKDWCGAPMRRGKEPYNGAFTLAVPDNLPADVVELMKAYSDNDHEKIERLHSQAREKTKSAARKPHLPKPPAASPRRKSNTVTTINEELEDIVLTIEDEPQPVARSPPRRRVAPPPEPPAATPLLVVPRPSDTVFQGANFILECDCGVDAGSFFVHQRILREINSHLASISPAWAHVNEFVFDGAHVDEILSWQCCRSHSTATRLCVYSDSLLRRSGPSAHRLNAWRGYIDYILECRRQLPQLIRHHVNVTASSDLALQDAIFAIPSEVETSITLVDRVISAVKLLCDADKYDAAAAVIKLWESELQWRSKHPYRCNQCDSHFVDARYCRLCGIKAEHSFPMDRPKLRSMVMEAIGFEAVAKLFTML
eukprot:TRINITY_DN3562_c0_g2_i1.p1 TRINITY_DN3562_c0_g2~~TRINITY_DN3562_c0_g2_i1.p1  ORF type:complete len:949 (+),score=140.07 TRINITY_DN3562_c0_g2_i1:86-2848(+)